nr:MULTISPECIES: hypothetical protein [Paracoccus]
MSEERFSHICTGGFCGQLFAKLSDSFLGVRGVQIKGCAHSVRPPGFEGVCRDPPLIAIVSYRLQIMGFYGPHDSPP